MDSITEFKNFASDMTGGKVPYTNNDEMLDIYTNNDEMLNMMCSTMLDEIKYYCDRYAKEKFDFIRDDMLNDSMICFICNIMIYFTEHRCNLYPEDLLYKKGVINKDEWNKIKSDGKK